MTLYINYIDLQCLLARPLCNRAPPLHDSVPEPEDFAQAAEVAEWQGLADRGIRVATRLLRFYALRELASGLDHRGVPISFPTRFGALEQGKTSRNGSALRKGHLEFFRADTDQESQSIS